MPLHRDTPRVCTKRKLLYHGERFLVNKRLCTMVPMFSSWRRLIYLRLCTMVPMFSSWRRLIYLRDSSWPVRLYNYQHSRRKAFVCLLFISRDVELLSLPYARSTKQYGLKTPDDFTCAEFFEQFRFRKEHFFGVLEALQDEHGDHMAIHGLHCHPCCTLGDTDTNTSDGCT